MLDSGLQHELRAAAEPGPSATDMTEIALCEVCELRPVTPGGGTSQSPRPLQFPSRPLQWLVSGRKG